LIEVSYSPVFPNVVGEKLGVLDITVSLPPDLTKTVETRMFELVKSNFLIEKEHAHWNQAKTEIELNVDQRVAALWKGATWKAWEKLARPVTLQLRRKLREEAHIRSAAILERNIVAYVIYQYALIIPQETTSTWS
jgi:hypothetical protein